jgi:hypothetical protein
MTWRLREAYGGATRLGFADIVVIANRDGDPALRLVETVPCL